MRGLLIYVIVMLDWYIVFNSALRCAGFLGVAVCWCFLGAGSLREGVKREGCVQNLQNLHTGRRALRGAGAEPERLATKAWGMSGPVRIQEQNRTE